MTSLLPHPILLFSAALILPAGMACSGGRGGGRTPAGDAGSSAGDAGPTANPRCETHCDIDVDWASACTESDRAGCLDQCGNLTAGLSFECAACVIDIGEPLSNDDDGLGTCVGSSVASIATAECASFCEGADHPGGPAEIGLRCDEHCDIGKPWAASCTESDRTECLEQCGNRTAGLTFECAACVIDIGEPLSNDDDGLGTCVGSSVADIATAECTSFC